VCNCRLAVARYGHAMANRYRYRRRMVQVRVSDDEGAVLDRAARVLGVTTATLLRLEALRVARAIVAGEHAAEPEVAPTAG
jgi:uncharacterized protein (DUF1778 family)